MEVTNKGRLHISSDSNTYLDYISIILSYIFHPVLLIVWILSYLLYLNPIVFAGTSAQDKLLVLLRISATSVFMPLITVFLLKGLGFIASIRLETQKERIIPYVACITFFFWSYYVSKKLNDPFELRAFLLSLFIVASVSLLLNNYFKISMHTIGFGGLNALFVLMLFNDRMNDGFILSLSFLIAGLVGMARLKRKYHQPFEVYAGYVTGMIVQVFSWWFLT